MDIRRLLFTLVATGCASAIAMPPIVVTNGLQNSCAKCMCRRCVVLDDTSLKPVFFEREVSHLEFEIAVALSISYSRHGVADGITFPEVCQIPPSMDSLVKHPLPYSVNGISLTNMIVRVFAFATHPVLATNDLDVVLVSFYDGMVSPEKFMYALYVSGNTGRVSDTIQGCSGYLGFLANAMRHPFLDEVECERQSRFFSALNGRRYGSHVKAPSKSPLSSAQIKLLGDNDIEVELVDPCPPQNGR